MKFSDFDKDTLWCVAKYAEKKYRSEAKVSQHFVQRIYQRFTPEVRAHVFAEIHSLITGGMWRNLFGAGQDTVTVLLSNNVAIVMCLDSKNKKLVFKTAIQPTKTRAIRIMSA